MRESVKKQPNAGGNGSFRNINPSNGGSNSFHESDSVKKSFNDRLDYLLVNGIGSQAIVTIPSGVKYEGTLTACNPSFANGIDVILKYPKVVDKGLGSVDVKDLAAELSETLTIKAEDVAELEIKDVDFTRDDKWEQGNSKASETKKETKKETITPKKAFKTDTAISGAGKDVKERELQKWAPDDAVSFSLENSTLEDDAGAWDQFAVNEKKFGIKPSYDEHFYTTRINKKDPNYDIKLKEAERIAREIESQGASGNIHIDEDRNVAFDDSGLDEEDKYSGVDRRGDELLAQLKLNAKPEGKPIKYVPPSLRTQPHNMDPAILSTTGKTKPSTRSEIAELKKFSEKFKVPYDMPDEVKTVWKKEEAHDKTKEAPGASSPQKNSGTLKTNPSLPPKPVSQPPNTPTLTSANGGGKNSNRSSKSGTPSLAKAEMRRGSQNKYSSSGKTPITSPSISRVETFGRRRQRNFFDDGKPKCLKKDLKTSFNMFLKSKEAYEEKAKERTAKKLEQFFIEKPYFTSPTWISTVDQSYKTLFPDERTAVQRTQMRLQQRSINMMAQGMSPGPGGMPMGMPVGVPPGAPPFMGGHPGSATGSHGGGMFMPFQPQPMFYPPMGGQMMPMMNGRNDNRSGSGANSQSSSPPATPAFINGVPVNMPYGYPMRFQGMAGPPQQQQQQQKAFHYHQNHNRSYRQHNGTR